VMFHEVSRGEVAGCEYSKVFFSGSLNCFF
jgi:hypothetical protein